MNPDLIIELMERCPDRLQLHLKRVAASAQPDTAMDTRLYWTGAMHDVVEDSYATWDEMAAAMNDDTEVLTALKLLTHDKANLSYTQYIHQIADSENVLAITVKLCDLLDHLHPARNATFPMHKMDLYLAAIKLLKAKLLILEAGR